MYKLFKDPITNMVCENMIIRVEDSACIPFDEANTDYQAYLKHIAEGGVVLPADDNEQTA